MQEWIVEFWELANVQGKRFLVNLFRFQLQELNLNLSVSKRRRSALSLLRLRIFMLNWTEQLLKHLQIQELLNPSTLQTAFTNAIQVAQFRPYGSKGKFYGKKQWSSSYAAGKDRTTDPDKSCNYCKDTVHDVDNCLHLQKHQAFLAHQNRSREGLNWMLLTLRVKGRELQLTQCYHQFLLVDTRRWSEHYRVKPWILIQSTR